MELVEPGMNMVLLPLLQTRVDQALSVQKRPREAADEALNDALECRRQPHPLHCGFPGDLLCELCLCVCRSVGEVW